MTVRNLEGNLHNILILPDELLIYIFKFLPMNDLLVCETVCNRWHILIRDAAVWRNIVFVYNESPNVIKCPYQEYVYCSKCPFDERGRMISIISSHADIIRCIKLQCVNSYETITFVTKICKNLTSLELVMCRIRQDFVYLIMKWPNLKKLILRNCYIGPNDSDFDIQYDRFKRLKHLVLSDFGLSLTNCYTLLQCQYLSHILIEKIKGLELKFIRELVLSKQMILETLHIYGASAIDNECLELISQCPRLSDLAIVRCENLGNKAFETLANIKEIKRLQIWNNNSFSEKTLLTTLGSPSLVKLQRLSLSKIHNVSPAVIDLLSEYYKNLTFLALYQCPKIINTDYEKQLKSKFRNIDVFLY